MLGPYTFKRSSHPTLRPFVERRDRVRVRDMNDVRVCPNESIRGKIAVRIKSCRSGENGKIEWLYANRDWRKIILKKLLGL